jgi:hypothetical protein
MTETAAGLQVWVDKLELAELIATLGSAVDRANQALITSCYAEESYDDHGIFKGSGAEFAEYVCHLPVGPEFKMHHLLGQSVFDVQGDEAWGETFLIYNDVTEAGNGYGFGRFVDYFQRIDGAWKVKYRRVITDKTTAGYDISTYEASTRDANDPAYDHRRWPDL